MSLPLLIGGSIFSGLMGANSANRATDAQAQMSREGIAEQRRQFDTILGMNAPQQQLGNEAVMQLGNLFFGNTRTPVPGLSPTPVIQGQQPQTNSQTGRTVRDRYGRQVSASSFQAPQPSGQPTIGIPGGAASLTAGSSSPGLPGSQPTQPSSISNFFAPESFSGNYGAAQFSANSPTGQFSGNFDPSTFSADYSPNQISANFAPQQFSGNYGASQLAANFGPSQFSGNYSPNQVSANFDAQQFSNGYGPQEFSFDPSQTQLSPAAQRVMDESMRAIQNSAAGRGNVLSGETLRSLSDRARDIASGEINNDFNRSLNTFNVNRGERADAFNRDFAAFNTNQAQKEGAFNRSLAEFGVNEGQRADAFNRGLTEFNVNQGQREGAFNRSLAEMAFNEDQRANQFNRGLTEFNTNQAQSDAGFNRSLAEFGVNEGQRADAYNRALTSFNTNQAQREAGFGRSLTEFNTNQAQQDNAFNRALTTFGVNRGEQADAFNRGITEFNVNQAQTGDFFNRLAALAGLGQTANTQVSGAAQNTGNNIASLLNGIGTARASGIQGQNQALQGSMGNLSMLALLNQGGYFNPAGG